MDFTKPDVYRQKALITKARRADQYARGRELQAQLNAYQKALVEARKASATLPSLSDFTAPQPAADGALQDAIDYGAELQELQDDIADREYHASGGW